MILQCVLVSPASFDLCVSEGWEGGYSNPTGRKEALSEGDTSCRLHLLGSGGILTLFTSVLWFYYYYLIQYYLDLYNLNSNSNQ